MRQIFAASIAVLTVVGSAAWVVAAPVTLSNVPAYDWYHGCGPTAAASLMGYYDLREYSDLFDASGWDAVKLTSNVQDHISSPAHNAKYNPTPDCSTLPAPPDTSLACWMETSVDPLQYGWSYLSYTDDAFEGYVDYRGYECSAWYEHYGSTLTWQDLVGEIDAERPLMFLVDSDGNGGTDHFVPVLGYDDRGDDGLWYAYYTTWTESETVYWSQFRAMSDEYSWGVYSATFVHMTPIPEPATLGLVALGACSLLLRRRRRRR